jgi:hypothetical protein
MPLSIQFGAWSPDQSETPLQIADQQGPVTVPCADCLNVIYVNGNFRNIASPSVATIDGNPIQLLSTTANSAFSYYDNVAQQETVFVGTGVGIQQLNSDGTWALVNLVTSQVIALVGQAALLKIGNFKNTSTLRAATLNFATGSLNTGITGTTFVAGADVLTGGDNGNLIVSGYRLKTTTRTGLGTIVNSQTPFGTLVQIQDSNPAPLSGFSPVATFDVSSPTDPTRNAFTTITAAGTNLNAATAVYSYSPSTQIANWGWSDRLFGFVSGTTYVVTFA